ncbi:MAG: GtrA family protein [Rhodanobacter lindaniclasticus]
MRNIASRISVLASSVLPTPPSWIGEVFRFLIGGVLNLVVGYGGYLLLLRWMHYEAAYIISYVFSVCVSYVFSTLVVFRQPIRARSALFYPLVYLVQFLLGFILLRVLVEILRLPTWIAPLLVSILTIPVTFLMSRIIVRTG